MESLKELYRIGTGPSSSHTMGPERAAHRFKEKYPQADRFFVTLYGSLAKTGKTFTRFPHSPTSKLTAPRVTCAFGSMRKSARARRFGTI